MRCPACEGQDWTTFRRATDMFTGERYRLVRCSGCGLARTESGTPAAESLYAYGGSTDAGQRFGVFQAVLRGLRRMRVRTLAMPKGRVLDVGCGDGSFLEAMAEAGWEVAGTELSGGIAASARARLGERLFVGSVEQLPAHAESFDLITFWHVLEHLEDPQTALSAASRLLKPGGRILVAVPNLDSWQSALFGGNWLHLDVPRHRWHFNPRTLEVLARRCGLGLGTVRHFSLEYGPVGVLQGVLTGLGLGFTLFTRLMRLSPAQLAREPSFWIHLPVAAAAAIPSLALEAIAALAGRGGSLVAVLKRP